MHAIEKILAKNNGKERVVPGEIVTAKIDFAEINDLYLQTIYSFYEMGGKGSGTTPGRPLSLTITPPPPPSKAPPTSGRCASSPRRTG